MVAYNVELIAKINHTKRTLIKKRIQNGNLPLYTLGFMDLKRQYSTCGLVGINEAVEFLGFNILTAKGQGIVKKLLTTVNKVNRQYEELFQTPHNCEQTPSENSAIKLAQADKLMLYQDEFELYSNQFIPLTTEATMLDRIKLQGMFDKHMTGGAICHINIADMPNEAHIPFMIKTFRKAVKRGVIYSAFNYNIQCCEDEHISVGKNNVCPACGKPIKDVFTRVVGFLVNVKNWHKTRREEDYPNRQWYEVNN